MRRIIVLGWFILALSAACQAARAPSSPAHPFTPSIQPICGVPGYAPEVSYRFGKHAKLLPGETPVRSAADMVNLGRHYDAPLGVGNGGFWQPYGALAKGDPGSDLAKRWVSFSVWWQPDRESKYVDDKLGITRAFKWTGGGWPNKRDALEDDLR